MTSSMQSWRVVSRLRSVVMMLRCSCIASCSNAAIASSLPSTSLLTCAPLRVPGIVLTQQSMKIMPQLSRPCSSVSS